MLDMLDLDALNEKAPEFRKAFETGQPFRHLVFDNLVKPEKLETLANEFPDANWTGWSDVDHEHQRYKRSCGDTAVIPENLRKVIFELNSGSFMKWLSDVTGIAQVLPDPHLIGGGLHMTTPGGTLTPHTDFHVVRDNPLYRRLNLLLYLNPGWQDENHGALELWDKKKDRIEHEVMPELGRCVIFQTDDVSLHGFTKPVAGRPRCSVALYYYTAEDADEFSGDGATYWRAQSVPAKGVSDWMRLRAYRSLLVSAHAASSFAWRTRKLAQTLRS